jgi:hypothetical protein|eukprot:COSAG03_NODE_2472_length_2723_cov_3.062881_1_plen_114_part_00
MPRAVVKQAHGLTPHLILARCQIFPDRLAVVPDRDAMVSRVPGVWVGVVRVSAPADRPLDAMNARAVPAQTLKPHGRFCRLENEDCDFRVHCAGLGVTGQHFRARLGRRVQTD